MSSERSAAAQAGENHPEFRNFLCPSAVPIRLRQRRPPPTRYHPPPDMKNQLTTGHRPEVSKTTDLIGTSRSCYTTLFAHRKETASNQGSDRGELGHIPSAITKSNSVS